MVNRGEANAEMLLLPEPDLEFNYAQRLHDPHAGLSLFGPYDAEAASHPKSIVYGIIGPPDGLDLFHRWSGLIQGGIVHGAEPSRDKNRKKHSDERKTYLLWPPFPGFEVAFHATWPTLHSGKWELDKTKLVELATHRDANRRAYDVVGEYCECLRRAKERDEAFHVMICVIPDEVWLNCRPQSQVREGAHGHALSAKAVALKRQTMSLFGAEEEYDMSVDFRRQLKARAMEFGIPIQIVRESTLRIGTTAGVSERELTPESDRAWNLWTTLYYKAGGKPWRLATARPGVCYVGLAFRRTDFGESSRSACCAAQMFLDTGDGVVFKGEVGTWYSPERKEFHLDKKSARSLLSGVLKSYSDQGGQPLREIFLHSRSSIDTEEFEGYRDACPQGVKLVGVRVKPESGVKLFRRGKWPVLRGTFWRLGERTGYLWASGFKPTVLSYDGWDVPNPLRIDVQHGDADIVQVANDILGLTKLNYNACKLGDSMPVTVGFSDVVGEILISNPTVTRISPNFKFYI